MKQQVDMSKYDFDMVLRGQGSLFTVVLGAAVWTVCVWGGGGGGLPVDFFIMTLHPVERFGHS